MFHSPDSSRDENDDCNEISERRTSDGPHHPRRQQEQQPLLLFQQHQQDNRTTAATNTITRHPHTFFDWDCHHDTTTTRNQLVPPCKNFHNNTTTSKNQTIEVFLPSSSWPNKNGQYYHSHQQQQEQEEVLLLSNQLLEPLQHDRQQLQHHHPSFVRPTNNSIATPTTRKDSDSDEHTRILVAATASPVAPLSGDHQQEHINTARCSSAGVTPTSVPPFASSVSSSFAVVDPPPPQHHYEGQQGQDISFSNAGQGQSRFMNTSSHKGNLANNHDNTYYSSSTLHHRQNTSSGGYYSSYDQQQKDHQGTMNQHRPHHFQNDQFNGYQQNRDYSLHQNYDYFCNARFVPFGQEMNNSDHRLHPRYYTNNRTTFPQQQEGVGTRTGLPAGSQNYVHPNFLNNTHDITNTHVEDHELVNSKQKKLQNDKLRPRRPLSAYNFFFKEEKMVVVALLPESPSTGDTASAEDNPIACSSNSSNTIRIDATTSAGQIQEYLVKAMEQKEKTSPHELVEIREQNEVATQKILDILYAGDKEKKSHKKRHGKISFQKLASVIGIRWRHLSDQEKQRYHDLSKVDNDRFKKMDQIYVRPSS